MSRGKNEYVTPAEKIKTKKIMCKILVNTI